MEFTGALFPAAWVGAATLLYALLMLRAVRWANWRRLVDSEQQNVFLGAVVGVMVFWALRTEIQPGFSWHLSAMVTLTLMFGWSLAVVAGSFALVGTTLFGLSDWGGFPLTALVFILLPATLAQTILGLARAFLPKHYFVYVFVNAFFAGGLIAVLVALVATVVLLSAGVYDLQQLSGSYLLFLPLMVFPEAVINGWLVSIMVGFKPHWVASFRDEEYLHGK